MTTGYTPDPDDKIFQNCQIGKGLKPLAQRGSVVFGSNGTLTLLGTNGDVIDSAALTSVTAKRVKITAGQTLSVVLDGRKYNVSSKDSGGAVGGVSAGKRILQLIDSAHS